MDRSVQVDHSVQGRIVSPTVDLSPGADQSIKGLLGQSRAGPSVHGWIGESRVGHSVHEWIGRSRGGSFSPGLAAQSRG